MAIRNVAFIVLLVVCILFSIVWLNEFLLASPLALLAFYKTYTISTSCIRKVVAVTSICVLMMFASAFQVFRVHSVSMEDTLYSGDLILVIKTDSYFNLSRPIMKYLLGRSEIKRFDIALYQNNGPSFIKRCVGMPGDTINLKDGKLTINSTYLQTPVDLSIKKNYKLLFADSLQMNSFVSDSNIDEIATVEILHSSIVVNANRGQIIKILKLDRAERVIDVDTLDSYKEPYLINRLFESEIVAPNKGEIIDVSVDNINLYYDAIVSKEHNYLNIQNNQIYLNNELVATYKFQNSYFYFLGDNRNYSTDSRDVGLISNEHIRGVVYKIIYTSTQGDIDEVIAL